VKGDRAQLTVSDDLLASSVESVPFTREELTRIARLALAITRLLQRRAGLVLHLPTWEEKTPEQQAAMRLGAERVIQALLLLGYITEGGG
jgi:hypothetical protein